MPGRIGAGGPFLVASLIVGGAELAGQVAYSYTQLVLIEGDQDAVRTSHNQRLLFGRSSAVAATPGAPWYLWKPQARVEAEEEPARPASNSLHQFRTGYQTVGQGFRHWPIPSVRLEAEEYAQPKPVDLSLFRNSAAVVVPTAGAPWYLWPASKRLEAEEEVQRQAFASLHLYRVGYQTVGQTWQQWAKPVRGAEPEEFEIRKAAQFPRAPAPTAQPGQPWWAWPAAKADQTVEPNPVVIDHAAALNPFRPHQALEPVVVVPDATATPGRKSGRLWSQVSRETDAEKRARRIAEGTLASFEQVVVEAKPLPPITGQQDTARAAADVGKLKADIAQAQALTARYQAQIAALEKAGQADELASQIQAELDSVQMLAELLPLLAAAQEQQRIAEQDMQDLDIAFVAMVLAGA